jgi:hypothetical protein
MNERTNPYCLLGALSIPSLWMGFFIIGIFMNTFFPDHSGGHVGDNNMAAGVFIFALAVAVSVVTSVILSIVSFKRNETLLGQGVGVWAGGVLFALFVVIIGATAATQYGR